jgi:hypothetical protein
VGSAERGVVELELVQGAPNVCGMRCENALQGFNLENLKRKRMQLDDARKLVDNLG